MARMGVAVSSARPPNDGTSWVWLSVFPLGLGAWAPVYAGAKAQNRQWLALGILWSLIVLAGWIGAVNLERSLGGGRRPDRRRLGRRDRDVLLHPPRLRPPARELVRCCASRRPGAPVGARAGSAPVPGEPDPRSRDRRRTTDLPGAQDAGLVDINGAPATVIAHLPGVDAALASRIVEARADTGGFSSVEDLGATLDLDAHLVEGIRGEAVFLSRLIAVVRRRTGRMRVSRPARR